MAVILSFILLGVGALKAGCANPTCDAGVAANCGGADYKGCQYKPAISASCTPKSTSACLSQYTADIACNGATTGCQWSSQSECARSADFNCSALNSAGNACGNSNCLKLSMSCVSMPDSCEGYSAEDCGGMTLNRYCEWTAATFSDFVNCSDLSGCKESGSDCIFDTAFCSTLTAKTTCESPLSGGFIFCTWSGSACVTRTGIIEHEGCKVVGSGCASETPPPVCVTDTSNPSGGCSSASIDLGCFPSSSPTCITPPCAADGNDCSTSSKGVGCTWRSGGTCKAKSPVIDCGLATASCGAGKEDIGCVSVSAVAASCDVKVGLGCDTITDQDGCETVGCKWTPADSKDAGDGAFSVLAPLFLLVVSMLVIL